MGSSCPCARGAEVRSRAPGGNPDGGGGGEPSVAWQGGAGETHEEYDDENMYDTATQACGLGVTLGAPPRAGAPGGGGGGPSVGWGGGGGGDGDGSDVDGDGATGGPAVSAASLQLRRGGPDELLEARTAVSRCVCVWS